MCPYAEMTVDEISALPVSDLAETDAHLYLWTTQRYLWDAKGLVETWGFSPKKVLVWAKSPTGFALGGPFCNATEFVVFASRGSLKAKAKVERDWWQWKRGAHSQKPEAFIDLVESISPGPYLEMFARRNRLGWDTWGNEAIEHVDLAI